MYTKECNKELNGVKGGVQQQLSASDDWTEEQDLTLRQAYFTARPSPHFWKKVSKLVLQVLPFCFFGGLIMSS
jgi:protein DEK